MFGYSQSRADIINTLTNSCLSWYGHSFEKFDDKSIFCPTCGAVRRVR